MKPSCLLAATAVVFCSVAAFAAEGLEQRIARVMALKGGEVSSLKATLHTKADPEGKDPLAIWRAEAKEKVELKDAFVRIDFTLVPEKGCDIKCRAELPLLAESAQASLKQIGADVDINCTANRREFLKDMTSWDIYASALVTAPSGDPQYFFTTSQSSNPDLFSNTFMKSIGRPSDHVAHNPTLVYSPNGASHEKSPGAMSVPMRMLMVS